MVQRGEKQELTEMEGYEQGVLRQNPGGLREADSRLRLFSFLSPPRSHPSISVWRNANSCYLLSASSV